MKVLASALIKRIKSLNIQKKTNIFANVMYSEKSKKTEKLLEPITGISRVFVKRKEFYTSAATNKIMMGHKNRDLHQRKGKNTI